MRVDPTRPLRQPWANSALRLGGSALGAEPLA
jgi:hypothetical protein